MKITFYVRTVFLLFLFAYTPPAFSDEPVSPPPEETPHSKVHRDDRKGTLFELGVSLGTPAGINFVTGIWGSTHFPLVLRLSGMDWGAQTLWGGEVDLAFAFGGRTKYFSQFLGAEATKMCLLGQNYTGYGPVYGLNFLIFAFQIGVAFGSGDFSSPQATLQIGLSGLW